MIREAADVAIVGSGFAGSLMALILERQGRRVILLERGCHPRFAIGESSTPLTNLMLEDLCRRYGLPRLAPLCKYGSWREQYPDLVCGLKRGFTFFRHAAGREYVPRADHANELLVAANPSEELGDTQWLREQIDHFLVREVRAAGIPYWDKVQLDEIEHRDGWTLRGNRQGDGEVEISAKFLIDASGSSSVLARALDIDVSPTGLLTESCALYTHFTGVTRWSDTIDRTDGWLEDHPYPCDDAVVHHILDEGWIWVIRFDNGVTSAGLVMHGNAAESAAAATPEREWSRVLNRYPSVERQFRHARAIRPLVRTGRLQRRAARVAGEDWAMLPHSAYFIDPLLSAGNAHSLLGIERLALSLEEHWGRLSLKNSLIGYQDALQREIEFLDRLVHGCYSVWSHFELLTACLMYYFAGAIYSETRRRTSSGEMADEFLFSHHEPWRRAVAEGCKTARELALAGEPSAAAMAAFTGQVAADIEPYNIAGLCDPDKHNMYPFMEAQAVATGRHEKR